jgi:hypothetical protein
MRWPGATQTLSLDRKLKQLYLISVAQFRPEKNHSMQLRAFALARQLAMVSAPSEAGALREHLPQMRCCTTCSALSAAHVSHELWSESILTEQVTFTIQHLGAMSFSLNYWMSLRRSSQLQQGIKILSCWLGR